jgi:signal transduction histidine kinase/ActR/RegA family two-component response regulator
MHNASLRRRLFLLALAGILPLAAMSGIALVVLALQQRAQAERDSLEITRALAIAVEGQLEKSISALGTLATANSLDEGNIDRFRLRAERFLQTQKDWRVIILADPQGKVLLNSNFPGPNPPPIAERESFDLAVRTLQPVVGNLAHGRLGQLGVPLRIPIVQEGRLRYILTGVLKPDALRETIQLQHLPPDWVVSVFDGKNVRVARSRAHEQFIGQSAGPKLLTIMASNGAEGTGIGKYPDGEASYTSYVRLKNHGWCVVIGIPAAIVETAAFHSMAVYGSGLLLSLVLGIIASLLVARRISQPISELRRAAQALGSGEPVVSTAGDIPETREVADALAIASRQLAANRAEREKLLADTEAARSQAETANRAKDDFLAMLGHELRNPLASIMSALELMNARGASTNAHERDIIGRQVAHLTHLVDDLLDVSRITKGKIQLERRAVDMRAVISTALELAGPSCERRTRQIETDLPAEPVYVLGDEVRLAQVISNLVINAAKFTPGDGRIAIRLRDAGGSAEVTVEDAGRGIPADLLPHIFDVFMQVQQPIDRQAGGLGLGLAIVKALVSLHGGTISAASRGPGQGSAFTVSLPRAECTGQAGARESDQPAPIAHGGRRILVVDDNTDAAETIALLLREAAGYDVHIEANGMAALAALEHFLPDVAILDIGLPGMTGYELAARMRSDPRLDGVRLIAVTGYGSRQDRAQAMESGFDIHLTKPVAFATLVDAIEKKKAA